MTSRRERNHRIGGLVGFVVSLGVVVAGATMISNCTTVWGTVISQTCDGTNRSVPRCVYTLSFPRPDGGGTGTREAVGRSAIGRVHELRNVARNGTSCAKRHAAGVLLTVFGSIGVVIALVAVAMAYRLGSKADASFQSRI